MKDIRAKVGEQVGGSDHSLFWPDHGLWLEAGRTLDFYDLKSGDLLELKKKHRILRVKILDGSIKTVWVDESANVGTVVALVCEKLGIANPAEYSFQPDENSNFGSQSALNQKTGAKKGAPAAGGTDNNWLNPDKTLPEQKISENEMVVLKKKFFFSDINIDRNDPVQLNLLYVQSKEAIVSGKYPVSPEEASQFAAIQLQVQSGTHDPDKHKPGFLNLNEAVPMEYRKNKPVEKMIYSEHRKLQGLTELNAKYRYIQLCRSLKTYGVSFFTVKEMNVKKNKLLKVMLGVTKDSVVRLDAETKEVIKSWPLTQLRRWAASPNSFTLDFGDYADAYYSVQTTEGEQISQLISGYIDIIIKKTKEAEKVCVDDVQQEATVEDYVRPSKFSRMNRNAEKVGGQQAQVGYYGGANSAIIAGGGRYAVAKGNTGQGTTFNLEPGSAQQIAVDKVYGALASLSHAVGDLNNVYELPPANFDDPSLTAWRLKTETVNTDAIASLVHAQLASTAHVSSQIALGDQGEMDVLGSNIAAMTSNMAQLANHAKLLAALESDSAKQEAFLNTCRLFGMATHSYLESVQGVLLGQVEPKSLKETSALVSATACNLLTDLQRINVSVPEREALINAAFVVSEAVKQAAAKSKIAASHFQDNSTRLMVAEDAKQTLCTAEILCESTQIVAPAYKAIVCQDVIMQTAIALKDGVATVADSASSCPNSSALEDLRLSSRKVYDTINRLIYLLKSSSNVDNPDSQDAMGNAGATLAAAATLTRGTLQYLLEAPLQKTDAISKYCSDFHVQSADFTKKLTTLANECAGEMDPVEKKRLTFSANAIVEATSLFVKQVKDCIGVNPPDEQAHECYMKTGSNLSGMIETALATSGPSGRVPQLNSLATYAQACAESSTMLFAASKSVSTCNRNAKSQQQLVQACRVAEAATSHLVYVARQYQLQPANPKAQYDIIQAARAVTSPLGQVIVSAKAAAPTVADSASQSHLLNAANTQADDLKTLVEALDGLHNIATAITVDGVLGTIREHKADLVAARTRYRHLRPQPKFASVEIGCEAVESETQALSQVTNQLASGASQNNPKIVLSALQDMPGSSLALCDACKSVSALSEDDALRTKVLDKGIFAITAAEQLVHALQIHGISNDGKNSANNPVVVQAKQVSAALNGLISILPGHAAIGDVSERINRLLGGLQAVAIKSGNSLPLPAARNQLVVASTALTMAITDIVAAAHNSEVEYQSALKGLESEFENLVNSVQPVINGLGTDSERQRLVQGVSGLHVPTSALLNFKFNAAECKGDNYNSKNELKSAALNLKSSIAKLISSTANPADGSNSDTLRQCDAALDKVSLATMLLDNASNQHSPKYTFADCLQVCNDQSKALLTDIASIQTSSRVNDHETLKPAVSSSGMALEKLTEAATTAALILALADPSTIPAKQPLVDIAKLSSLIGSLSQVTHMFAKGVVSVSNPQATNPILDSLTESVPVFVNELKNLTGNSMLDSNLRAKLAANYKNTTNVSLPNFLSSIKAQSIETPKNAAELLNGLNELQQLIDGNVALSGTPAYFGSTAQTAQKPILDANRELLVHGNNLLSTTKAAVHTKGDKDTLTFLSQHSRNVAEALKNLTSLIASVSPGQNECSLALNLLEQYSDDVESAIAASNEDRLEAPEKDHAWYAQGLHESMNALKPQLDDVASAAKSDAVRLAKVVGEVPTLVNSVISYATGLAADFSQPGERELRQDILLRAKALAETTTKLVRACRMAGGNPKTVYGHQLDTAHSEAIASWKELERIAQEISGESADQGPLSLFDRELGQILAKHGLENPLQTKAGDESYSTVGAKVQQQARQYAATVQQVAQAAKNVDALEPMGQTLFQQFNSLMQTAVYAASVSEDDSVKRRLYANVSNLGSSVKGLLGAMRAVKAQPDASNRVKLASQVKEASGAIAELMESAKLGMKAVMDVDEANETLSNVILDLDSALIFAKAGQLDPINAEKEQFANYSENILKNTKTLSDTERSIISAATTDANTVSVEKLAETTKAAATSMVSLKDALHLGVTAITSSDKRMQLELLNTAKSVASALQTLINNAYKMRTVAADGAANTFFAENVKENVVAVSSLVRLVNLLADEGSRGLRALETTGGDIRELLDALQSDPPAIGSALPEEVAVLAKQIGQATLALSNNSGSKEGLVTNATTLRKLFEDISRVTIAAIEGAPPQARTDVKGAISNLGSSVLELLNQLKRPGANKTDIQDANKTVGSSVTTVCDSVSRLTPTGYFDKNDPNVVAERELMQTAQAMEIMVSKIRAAEASFIKPGENLALDVDAQIFEGAKAIAAATSVLLRTATSLQREIVANERHKGTKVPTEKYIQNGQWSDGLVGCAKQVAATVGELCDLANTTLKASADGAQTKELHTRREQLVVTGRSINAATSQLIMAACTKTDDTQSTSLTRLKAASKTVVTSVDQIVRVVEDNLQFERDNTVNVLKVNGTANSIAVEMQAQMEILKVEQELEKARRRLADVRKNKYKGAGSKDGHAGGNAASIGNANPVAGSAAGTIRGRSDIKASGNQTVRGIPVSTSTPEEQSSFRPMTPNAGSPLERTDSQSSNLDSKKSAPMRRAPPPPPPAASTIAKQEVHLETAAAPDNRTSTLFREQPMGKRVSKLAEHFANTELRSNEEINQNNAAAGQQNGTVNAKSTLKTLNPFSRNSKVPALPTAESIFQSNPLYDTAAKTDASAEGNESNESRVEGA